MLRTRIAIVCGLLALLCGRAHAVVLHPGAPAISHPADAVVGKWAGASAVAIAPNWFISSAHQGGSVGGLANFGGTNYLTVAKVTITDSNAVPSLPADIVLWQIASSGGGPSTFASYTPIHTAPSITAGTSVVMGGFGRTRNANLTNVNGDTYGYTVTGSNSSTVTWGQNRVDSAALAPEPVPPDAAVRRSVVLVADFDGPGYIGSETAEATLAPGDSGGGWFINDGGWKLLAVTRAVLHPDQAIFGTNTNPVLPNPEPMDGVWVAAYQSQILAAIPEPGSAALLLLLSTGVLRRRHVAR